MKMKRLGWVAVAGLMLGCATTAPQQQASGEKTAASSDAEGELICEEQRTVGSHLRKRVCRTREQVEQEREAARRALNEPERANPRMGQ